MSFSPFHDRVLVRRIEGDETTKGGLIIPDTAKEMVYWYPASSACSFIHLTGNKKRTDIPTFWEKYAPTPLRYSQILCPQCTAGTSPYTASQNVTALTQISPGAWRSSILSTTSSRSTERSRFRPQHSGFDREVSRLCTCRDHSLPAKEFSRLLFHRLI